MAITLVPHQYTGMKTGASTEEELATRHDAILLFEDAKKRLLDVNGWHALCGPASAEFLLTDKDGNPIKRGPQEGDLIRIKLPAPPDPHGDGFDWVRVEEFEQSKDMLKDEEIFGFRVRPVQSPAQRDGEAAHFYTSTATSTFYVKRVSTTVSAMEKGRNEVPNNKVKELLSKVRHTVIAVGAWLGLSKGQWHKLVKGIVKGPPHDQ